MTLKTTPICQTSEIPFNPQYIRTVSHFIQKLIAPNSILSGGSSDYKKSSLNTLEFEIKKLTIFISDTYFDAVNMRICRAVSNRLLMRSIISDFFIKLAFYVDFSQEVRLLVVKKVIVSVDQITVNEISGRAV